MSRNGDSKISSATSAFLRFNLCFETFDTPIRRQSVKLPQMSNKPIELDLPGQLFLIGKGSLKAGSQTAVKIEVWSYKDRSVVYLCSTMHSVIMPVPIPLELIPLGIYNLHSEVGRYLAVHWLRTDPSGLVRPLSPPISLATLQTSSSRPVLPGSSRLRKLC